MANAGNQQLVMNINLGEIMPDKLPLKLRKELNDNINMVFQQIDLIDPVVFRLRGEDYHVISSRQLDQITDLMMLVCEKTWTWKKRKGEKK